MNQTEKFKVIKREGMVKSGTTLEYIQEVECPHCGNIFYQKVSEGCFDSREEPGLCPKCNYPLNSSIAEKLREALTLPKTETEKEWNPSKRSP